ncbi:MAG: hypothetical protein LC776_04415, partial [Acidobacteria bacterium]|nr:hypothetical protein [Acidobacteriota bacterium]
MVSSPCCSFVVGFVTANDEQLGRGGQALFARLPQFKPHKNRELQPKYEGTRKVVEKMLGCGDTENGYT